MHENGAWRIHQLLWLWSLSCIAIAVSIEFPPPLLFEKTLPNPLQRLYQYRDYFIDAQPGNLTSWTVDGALRWTVKGVDCTEVADFVNTEDLIVCKDSTGSLISIRASTGALLWQTDRDGGSYALFAPASSANVLLAFSTPDDLRVVVVSSGKLVWSYRFSQLGVVVAVNNINGMHYIAGTGGAPDLLVSVSIYGVGVIANRVSDGSLVYRADFGGRIACENMQSLSDAATGIVVMSWQVDKKVPAPLLSFDGRTGKLLNDTETTIFQGIIPLLHVIRSGTNPTLPHARPVLATGVSGTLMLFDMQLLTATYLDYSFKALSDSIFWSGGEGGTKALDLSDDNGCHRTLDPHTGAFLMDGLEVCSFSTISEGLAAVHTSTSTVQIRRVRDTTAYGRPMQDYASFTSERDVGLYLFADSHFDFVLVAFFPSGKMMKFGMRALSGTDVAVDAETVSGGTLYGYSTSGRYGSATVTATSLEAPFATLWESPLGVAGWYTRPPAVGSYLVYVALSETNIVAALDKSTGEVKLRTFLTEFCGGSLINAVVSSIVMDDLENAFFTAYTPCVYKIDSRDFKVVPGIAPATLIQSPVVLGQFLLTFSAGGVHAFDSATMKIKWSAETYEEIAQNSPSAPSIVPYGSLLMVLTRGSSSWTLWAVNAQNGQFVGRLSLGSAAPSGSFSGVYYYGSTVLVVAGQSVFVISVDFAAMTAMRLRQTVPLPSRSIGAGIAEDATLYVGTETGTTRFGGVSDANLIKLWDSDIAITSGAYVSSGVLYGFVRTMKHVVALNYVTGSRWLTVPASGGRVHSYKRMLVLSQDTSLAFMPLPYDLVPVPPTSAPPLPPPTGILPSPIPVTVVPTPAPTPAPPPLPFPGLPTPTLEWAISSYNSFSALLGSVVIRGDYPNVVAYDMLSSGRVVWRLPFFCSPSASAKFGDVAVCVHESANAAIATVFELRSGRILFNTTVGNSLNAHYSYYRDYRYAHTLVGLRLAIFFVSEQQSSWIGFNVSSGKVLWRIPFNESFADLRRFGAVVENPAKGYFAFVGTIIEVHDAFTGTALWETRGCNSCDALHIPRSFDVSNDTLWVCADGSLHGVSLADHSRWSVPLEACSRKDRYSQNAVPLFIKSCDGSRCNKSVAVQMNGRIEGSDRTSSIPLVMVSAVDLQIMWETSTHTREYASGVGTVIILDDVLYVATDSYGSTFAVRVADGSVKWNISWSLPLLYVQRVGRCLMVPGFFCLDEQSGRALFQVGENERWGSTDDEFGIFRDGTVLVQASTLSAMTILWDHLATVHEFSENIFLAHNKSTHDHSSHTVVGFGTSGSIFAVDVPTEKLSWVVHVPVEVKDRWQYRPTVGVILNGILHAVYSPYVVHVDVAGKVGIPVHTTNLATEKCFASQFSGGYVADYANAKLFLVDLGCLHMIDKELLLTQADVLDTMPRTMKPVLIGDRVFVGDASGHVHSYNTGNLNLEWTSSVDAFGYPIIGLATYGSRLYAYTQTYLYHVSATTGTVVGIFANASGVIQDVKSYNGTILVTTEKKFSVVTEDLKRELWSLSGEVRYGHVLPSHGAIIVLLAWEAADITCRNAYTGATVWDANLLLDNAQCFNVKDASTEDTLLLDCYLGVIALSANTGALLSVVLPGAQNECSMRIVGDHVVVASNSDNSLSVVPLLPGSPPPSVAPPTVPLPTGTFPANVTPATVQPTPNVPPVYNLRLPPLPAAVSIALGPKYVAHVFTENGRLVVVSRVDVSGYLASNGSLLWRATSNLSAVSVALDESHTDRVVVSFADSQIRSYDAATGEVLWTFAADFPRSRLVSVGPYIAFFNKNNGTIYFLSAQDGTFEMDVRENGVQEANKDVISSGTFVKSENRLALVVEKEYRLRVVVIDVLKKVVAHTVIDSYGGIRVVSSYLQSTWPYVALETRGPGNNYSVQVHDLATDSVLCSFRLVEWHSVVALFRSATANGSLQLVAASASAEEGMTMNITSYTIPDCQTTAQLVRPLFTTVSLDVFHSAIIVEPAVNRGDICSHFEWFSPTLEWLYNVSAAHTVTGSWAVPVEKCAPLTDPSLVIQTGDYPQNVLILNGTAATAEIPGFSDDLSVYQDPKLGTCLVQFNRDKYLIVLTPLNPVAEVRMVSAASKVQWAELRAPDAGVASPLCRTVVLSEASFASIDLCAPASQQSYVRSDAVNVSAFMSFPPNVKPSQFYIVGKYMVLVVSETNGGTPYTPDSQDDHLYVVRLDTMTALPIMQFRDVCGGDSQHEASYSAGFVLDDHTLLFAAKTTCLYRGYIDDASGQFKIDAIALGDVVKYAPQAASASILVIDEHAFMYSLNRVTYRVLWRRNIGYFPGAAVSRIVVLPASGASPERAVVVTGAFVVCVSVSDGEPLWTEYLALAAQSSEATQVEVAPELGLMLVSIHGMLSAIRTTGTDRNNRTVWVYAQPTITMPLHPAIVDGLLPVQVSGKGDDGHENFLFVALNVTNGSVVWTMPDAFCGDAVAVHKAGERTLLYLLCESGTGAFELQTGSMRSWLPSVRYSAGGYLDRGFQRLISSTGAVIAYSAKALVVVAGLPVPSPRPTPDSSSGSHLSVGVIVAACVALAAAVAAFVAFLKFRSAARSGLESYISGSVLSDGDVNLEKARDRGLVNA